MKLNLSRSITYFFNIKNKFNDNNYQIYGEVVIAPLSAGHMAVETHKKLRKSMIYRAFNQEYSYP